jgi:FkbM family methyltransferase
MDKNKGLVMLKIEQIIEDEYKKQLVNKFLNSNTEKYILGRNENAKRLSKYVSVDGYIDDFTNETSWQGKSIFKGSQIENKNAIVVSCSLAIYPHGALNSLKNAGFQNIVNILDISNCSDLDLQIMFLSNAKEDFENNFINYENIYNLMNEDESKNAFKNILSFRKNFNLKYMKEYKVDEIGQYFEDFLNLQEGEVFVDAGGFDGQTSIEFIKHCPKYKSIYIFEPDSDNLGLAKKNLANFKNVNFISKGLSNKKDTLKFDTGSGSASSISENGSIEIQVDTLDNLVKQKVSFIKMDIEGAEGLAIEGMKNHILNDHPKMAISVYHKVDDFWKIPEQIFAIRDDYDIYMRHYTEGTDETVMFFIPKNK